MARKGSFGDFVSTLHFIIPQYVHQKKLKKIQTAEFVFKIKRLICTASRLISVGTLWDICTRYNLSKSAKEQRLVVICNTALSLWHPKSYLTSDASRIWKSSIHCLFEKKESMLRTVCAAVQQSRQQPPVRLPGWQSADSEAATCSPVFLRTLCIGPESS